VAAAISNKILNDESVLSQMQGEFSIIKNYGNDEAANMWGVNNPHKPKGADFYVYTFAVSSLTVTKRIGC
jgi:hypothetical protein